MRHNNVSLCQGDQWGWWGPRCGDLAPPELLAVHMAWCGQIFISQ